MFYLWLQGRHQIKSSSNSVHILDYQGINQYLNSQVNLNKDAVSQSVS